MSLNIPLTHPLWEKLLTGKVQHKFSLFAANVAVEHAAREYAKNKSEKLRLASQLQQFFSKYEKLVAADLQKII